MRVFLISFFLLGAAFANPVVEKIENIEKTIESLKSLEANFETYSPDYVQVTVNNITDQILVLVSQMLINQGLDPMPLPDVHKEISWSGILIDYKGELNLTKGWLTDASTLFRGGDVILKLENKILTVDVPLNWVDFLFDYNYLAEFMGLGPEGTVDGKVVDVEVFCRITIDLNIKRIELDTFKVVDTGKINLNFHGNALIDWLLDILSDVITLIFDGLIYHIAEDIIADKLRLIIDQLNILWNSQ